jgi:hypothetical protein
MWVRLNEEFTHTLQSIYRQYIYIYIWHVFHNGENHDTPFRVFPPHSQPGAGPRQFPCKELVHWISAAFKHLLLHLLQAKFC